MKICLKYKNGEQVVIKGTEAKNIVQNLDYIKIIKIIKMQNREKEITVFGRKVYTENLNAIEFLLLE